MEPRKLLRVLYKYTYDVGGERYCLLTSGEMSTIFDKTRNQIMTALKKLEKSGDIVRYSEHRYALTTKGENSILLEQCLKRRGK